MENNTKRALVTGGTRGIGKAIVKELATRAIGENHFADVVFTYNSNKDLADQLEKEFEGTNVKVYGIKADSSNLDEVNEAINFTKEKLGGLDFLVNNAGITRDNLMLRMSEEDWG